jgi:uncharacterized protein (TIGR02117 family)
MIKKIMHRITEVLYALLSLIALYLLAVAVLPYIAVNTSTKTNEDLTIYLMSNGVHTDIVCPLYTPDHYWTPWVPFENTRAQRNDFTHVAFGWGDKGFYLNTPTWADLTLSTAFKAAFGRGEAAMHVTFYHTPQVNQYCRPMAISSDDYALLCLIIKSYFKTENNVPIHIPTDQVYGHNDAFYEAKSTYNLFFTCNTWTNKVLKYSNQKAAFWTATDWGILHHYPLVDADK